MRWTSARASPRCCAFRSAWRQARSRARSERTQGRRRASNVLPAWVSAEGAHIRGGGSFHAGARIAARGRIADRRASRDDSLVTRLEPPELLAWTTRSRVPPYPDAIEFRWSLSL